MTNSTGPDQTAPLRAVWSGSSLFLQHSDFILYPISILMAICYHIKSMHCRWKSISYTCFYMTSICLHCCIRVGGLYKSNIWDLEVHVWSLVVHVSSWLLNLINKPCCESSGTKQHVKCTCRDQPAYFQWFLLIQILEFRILMQQCKHSLVITRSICKQDSSPHSALPIS